MPCIFFCTLYIKDNQSYLTIQLIAQFLSLRWKPTRNLNAATTSRCSSSSAATSSTKTSPSSPPASGVPLLTATTRRRRGGGETTTGAWGSARGGSTRRRFGILAGRWRGYGWGRTPRRRRPRSRTTVRHSASAAPERSSTSRCGSAPAEREEVTERAPRPSAPERRKWRGIEGKEKVLRYHRPSLKSLTVNYNYTIRNSCL